MCVFLVLGLVARGEAEARFVEEVRGAEVFVGGMVLGDVADSGVELD